MRVLFVSLFIVIADQATKLLVKGFSIPLFHIKYAGMFQGERISIIGNFFRLTFIENPGMAFGFDPGLNMKLWISLFSLVASIALVIYLYINRHKALSLRLAIAFIIGGAVGNLIDRMLYGVFYGYAPLFYGRVVDFLDFDFFKFTLFGKSFDRWPIFNLADAAVTIGVIILIIFYKQARTEEENEAAAAEAALNTEAAAEDRQSAGNINPQSKLKTGTDNRKNGQPDNGKEISD